MVVVGRMLDEMISLLGAADAEDEVEKRLFPDAYEDAADARKFKDLVGDELRSGKIRTLEAMRGALVDGGGTTELSAEDAETWLRGLTDLRLALGERLDVSEEKMNEIPDADDPDGAALGLLHWLGWLQERMIETLERSDDETR